jgi:hypothetical protein
MNIASGYHDPATLQVLVDSLRKEVISDVVPSA